jgi:molybdopterin-guanine dinucleotide biosynthesis protein A
MGKNKALLRLEGERLIERVVGCVEHVSDDIMVVTNDETTYDFLSGRVRFVRDSTGPGRGPLAGIASALQSATYPRVLIVATDMPFLNPDLLAFLASRDLTADVTVPLIAEDGFPETLHAIYHKRALPAIEAQLACGRGKITAFFPEVQVCYVTWDEIAPFDPGFRSFFNANTPGEWLQALTM